MEAASASVSLLMNSHRVSIPYRAAHRPLAWCGGSERATATPRAGEIPALSSGRCTARRGQPPGCALGPLRSCGPGAPPRTDPPPGSLLRSPLQGREGPTAGRGKFALQRAGPHALLQCTVRPVGFDTPEGLPRAVRPPDPSLARRPVRGFYPAPLAQ